MIMELKLGKEIKVNELKEILDQNKGTRYYVWEQTDPHFNRKAVQRTATDNFKEMVINERDGEFKIIGEHGVEDNYINKAWGRFPCIFITNDGAHDKVQIVNSDGTFTVLEFKGPIFK